MEIPELIEELRRYGLSNGGSLGRHMGIMDLAADALEKMAAEKKDTDEHLKAISDSLAEQLRRAAPENKRLIDADVLSEEIQHLQIFLAGESLFTPAIKETILRTIDDQATVAAPENKPLTCEGCDNQKCSPKHSAFSYEDCMRCRRHWPDRHARKPEGSET